MESHIIVPQDAGADASSRDEVAQLAQLFGADAFATRMATIEAASKKRDGLPLRDDEVGAKVRRSMSWGTVVEVALRLLVHGLDDQAIVSLDAMATALRVSRGLAERMPTNRHPLVDALTEIADEIRESTGVGEWIVIQHREVITHLRAFAAVPHGWTPDQVKMIVESLPVKTILAASAEVLGVAPADMWFARIASHYGPCQYLAMDLGGLLYESPTAGILISPVQDAIRLAHQARDAGVIATYRSSVSVALPILDSHAAQLKLEMDIGIQDGAPEIAIQYATAALKAAGVAYQGLVAHHLV